MGTDEIHPVAFQQHRQYRIQNFSVSTGQWPLQERTVVLYYTIMGKGGETKQKILEIGLDMASRLGLDAVSIGALAKATGMSKSGLFAHFQSKENLQLDILRYAGDLFRDCVVVPTLKTEAGIPQIKALVANWDRWEARKMAGGCIFVQASNDFKERKGKVRDYLLSQQEKWIGSLGRIARSAIRAGHFGEGIDCDQFAFEFYSLLLGFHFYYKLLKDEEIHFRQEKALLGLIQRYRCKKRCP
jgi:AcrR family transcriptional regulator